MADAKLTLTVETSVGTVERIVFVDDTKMIRIIDALAAVYPDSNGVPGGRAATIRRWFIAWLKASRDTARKQEQDVAAKAAKDAVTEIDIGNI